MCGVKTFATLDKKKVHKVFQKIKQHNMNIKNNL